MAIVRYTPDPSNPARFTAEELARLDAMTDEEITAAALSDPDNPPLTDEELDRMVSSRTTQDALRATGLSTDAFALRYMILPGHLSDLENGRVAADAPTLYFLRQIAADPEGVRAALDAPAYRRTA